MRKILKNTTVSDISLTQIGRLVPANDQIEIETYDFARLSASESITELTPLINAGDIVVNNGSEDLEAAVGIEHVSFGTVSVHEDVPINLAVSLNAPELYIVGPAVQGFRMEIGDQIFTQSRYDNIIGETFTAEIHLIIDNSVADRWVAFELSYITTTGSGDKTMNGTDVTVTIGPFLVPTTPWEIFSISFTLPTASFQNGERYIFASGTRVDVTSLGKTNPTNDPVVLRICKIYKKRVST